MNLGKLFLILICFSFLACNDDNSSTQVVLNADFSVESIKINQGDLILYTNLSTGSPDTYQWTFEGGNPSNSTHSPYVRYDNFGSFRATLDITREADGTSSSKEIEITVYPTSGMISYYPLNGNADDISGNGHSGEIVGASLDTDRNNEIEMAYDFDGVDDYISTSTLIDAQLSEGATFAAWIKLSTGGSADRFISNYNGQSTGGDCLGRVGFVFSASNENRLRISYATDGNDYIGRMSDINSLDIGNWHHVVGVWNGEFESSAFKLYIDGIQSDVIDLQEGDVDCGYLESAYPFEFGRGQCATGPCALLSGSLDEIRIYSKILTQEEITVLSN